MARLALVLLVLLAACARRTVIEEGLLPPPAPAVVEVEPEPLTFTRQHAPLTTAELIIMRNQRIQVIADIERLEWLVRNTRLVDRRLMLATVLNERRVELARLNALLSATR